jgi:uncharacterized membrane protein
MSAPGHLDFYAVVLFVHITAAIVAFGVTFAYPVLDTVFLRRDARSLPAYHEAEIEIGRRIVTPAAIVVLIAGIYLVTDRWSDASSGWWSAALAILVVILGIEHAIRIPTSRRMRDRAALDAREAGSGGTVALSDEYARLGRQRRLFGGLNSLLVVVAVFLMVVKPGV